MYSTDDWDSGIMGLSEDTFGDTENDIDTNDVDSSWDDEDDSVPTDEAVSVWSHGIESIEEADIIIDDDHDDDESEIRINAEKDAFKNDPAADDGRADLMDDSDSVETIEMEAFLW